MTDLQDLRVATEPLDLRLERLQLAAITQRIAPEESPPDTPGLTSAEHPTEG